MYIYIYIYISLCVCVCVCVCLLEGDAPSCVGALASPFPPSLALGILFRLPVIS